MAEQSVRASAGPQAQGAAQRPAADPAARPVGARAAASSVEDDLRLLTAEEVVRILRLKEHAPRAPREALRNLVRRGRLQCLRQGPGKRGRMLFLRRHVRECLARWEQWGRA